MKHIIKPTVLGVALAVSLSACTTGAIIAGTVATGVGIAAIGTTAVVASDRRPVKVQYLDRSNSNRLQLAVKRQFPEAYTDLIVYNKRLLVTGEAPSKQTYYAIERYLKDRAGPDIQFIYNKIGIGSNSTKAQRTHDGWITTQVRTLFTTNQNIPENSIQIVTTRGQVHLMGLVTADEASEAARVAATVEGVTKVVKAFEEFIPKN
ncbi:MAG: BON domain-containing protein [Alcaligenaceae bacterium]|nr:BON domain-containing protein [Alcaligenaceae bacterium]